MSLSCSRNFSSLPNLLSRRLLTAAVLIASVLVFVFADAYRWLGAPAGAFLLPVHFLFVVGTGFECASLTSTRYKVSSVWIVASTLVAALVCAMPVLSSWLGDDIQRLVATIGLVGWSTIAVTMAVTLLGVDALREYGRTRESVVVRLALGCFIVAYCVLFSHFLLCLRLTPADYSGLILMVGVIASIKMSDAGAYFVGRSLGKRPLHSIISPKKTWEGAIGGVLIGAMTAAIFFPFASNYIFGSSAAVSVAVPFWGPALTGGLLAIFGLIGDLLESVIKRSVDAKDSGTLLPGLGGMWDVTDSLFFAAPIGYLAAVMHLIA